MSESACLNLISQRFNVIGVRHETRCEKNPNALKLTDEQIKNLL